MSGIFGIVGKDDISRTLLYATDYHSHLGTQFAGVALMGDSLSRKIHNISQSQFKSKFFDDIRQMNGNKGIGVISSFDEQPIYLHSKFGPFCLVLTGLIENKEQLIRQMFARGVSFSEASNGLINEAELAAKVITQGQTIVEGIELLFDQIQGSCSLLILTKDGLYAARDRLGFTPLVVGQRQDALAVASESCSFANNDFKVIKYLAPAEIVFISDSGIEQVSPGSDSMQICSFLWIYTGFPASSYEGINVEVVRERCGRFLAKRDKGLEIDIVSGVPDSGIAHALGYAMESGKPYRRPLVKYTPGYGRSYTPPTQETRDLIARMKLIPIEEIIKGNRIIVCEDSIVRGTQLKNFTIKKLQECQVKEIHVRPACPPLLFPCKFNLSTRSSGELVARRAIRSIEGQDIEDISEYIDHNSEKYRKMVDWIARDLEVNSLKYQTVDDMVASIGLPREKLCLYCWTGKCQKQPSSPNKPRTYSSVINEAKKILND